MEGWKDKNGVLMVEVVAVGVVVELQVLRIAIALEQVDDPCLLLGRQQALAVVVAIIVAGGSEILVHGFVQRLGVLALHLLEQRVEAPGHQLGLTRLKELTAVFTYLDVRIDCMAEVVLLVQMLPGQIPQTFLPFRAFRQEAPDICWWYVAEVECDFFFSCSITV